MTKSELVPELVPGEGRARAETPADELVPPAPPLRGRDELSGLGRARPQDQGRAQIPTWLATHIATLTGVNPTGVTRRARPGRCPDCNTWILTGLDHDRIAATATADPQPLNPTGEAIARLTGRATYDLTDKPRLTLDNRESWTIAAHPPSPSRYVVAQHRCHAPLPNLDAEPPTTTRGAIGDRPPY